ncbi:MAG: hypothetical protein ACR2OY_09085 [Boseongicola sp.]
MRILAFLAVLSLGGCASLIADFQDDLVGSPPSIFPAGDPDDEIRLSFSFQGEVRGLGITDPTGIGSGRQSLEITGNSSITFLSETIPEPQQSSRHRVSFLFTDGTARGKSISFGQGSGSGVRFRSTGDTLTIRRADGEDEQEFPITALRSSKVRIIVDPPTGQTRVTWQPSSETITWETNFAVAGEGRVTQFSHQFSMDNGGRFPRGLIVVDDVYANWSPRIRLGTPS